MNIFGFQITKPVRPVPISPVQPQSDGELTLTSSAFNYSAQSVDLENVAKDENSLIRRYREIAQYADVVEAIDDIVDESIIQEGMEEPVSINLDQLAGIPDEIKEKITFEFKNVLDLLKFNKKAQSIFRKWYVDGRCYFQILLDEKNPKYGIIELRPIDPRKIKKIKEIIKDIDPNTGSEIVKAEQEYYIYNDKGLTENLGKGNSPSNTSSMAYAPGMGDKLSPDSVAYVHSGLTDDNSGMVLGFLHAAIKPTNQLKMMEDSFVIYFISRAPERRIFYIDVGGLPKQKAEQYVQDIMSKYRNKLTYDVTSGSLTDERKFMSMLEDFWIPRRCISLDTRIQLLDGRSESLQSIIDEFTLGKELWTYSVAPDGNILPGKITWAGITGKNQKVIKIILDNDNEITCTPDHKFILRDGLEICAQELRPGDSLMPGYIRTHKLSAKYSGKYTQVWNNKTNRWNWVHRLVAKSMLGEKAVTEIIHHKNHNRYDNSPNNLVFMDKLEHFKYHSQYGTNVWKNGNVVEHKRKLSESGKKFFKTDAGRKRKEEISQYNHANIEQQNKYLQSGRDEIRRLRTIDKGILSEEEYLRKWSPSLFKRGIFVRYDKHNFEIVSNSLKEIYNQRKTHKIGGYVIEFLKNKRTAENFLPFSDTTLRKMLQKFGYQSVSDYVRKELFIPKTKNRTFVHKNKRQKVTCPNCQLLGDVSLLKRYHFNFCPTVKEKLLYVNHKVKSIRAFEEKQDVGTLTIDGNEIYHNYHNFLLDAGIFVRNSDKTTEITTLPGGMNLMNIQESLSYFQNKLYQALKVPISRRQQQEGGALFTLGRSSEITRDEIKFHKFINRLLNQFSNLFSIILKIQLVAKQVIRIEEWEQIEQKITYDFKKDNLYAEFKDSEVKSQRLNLLGIANQFVGNYFSKEWIFKEVLKFTDEETKQMMEQIAMEIQAGLIMDPNMAAMQELEANEMNAQQNAQAMKEKQKEKKK
jgi:hypothetical protein